MDSAKRLNLLKKRAGVLGIRLELPEIEDDSNEGRPVSRSTRKYEWSGIPFYISFERDEEHYEPASRECSVAGYSL